MTQNNIQFLLEWKNAKLLSKKKQVIANKLKYNLTALNDFRKLPYVTDNELDEFWVFLESVIKHGIVWKVFILHITRPTDFPIVDQHVLRAWNYIEMGRVEKLEQNWSNYEQYRSFFMAITKKSGSDFRTVDRALMAFGQFLKSQFFNKSS